MIGLVAKPHTSTFNYVTPGVMAVDFPADNVLNNDYGRVARTIALPANAEVLLIIDLGIPKPVDVLAVLWHTLPTDATLQYRGGASRAVVQNSGGYVSAYVPATTGLTARDDLKFLKNFGTLSSPITYRVWGVNIKLGATPAIIQLSKFFVGKGANFAIGPQKATIGAKDLNANVTTEVGETRSQEDASLIRPVVGLSFEYAKQSEMEVLLGQYTLSLGVSKPMLVCTDLTSPYLQDNIAYGRPEKVVTHESSMYDVWSFEAVVTSLGV